MKSEGETGKKAKLLYIYALGSVDGAASQALKTIPYLTEEYDVEILDAREYPTLPVPITKYNNEVPLYVAQRIDAAIVKLDPDIVFLHAFDDTIAERVASARAAWKGKLIWRFGANFTEHFLVHPMYGEGSTLPITLTHFIPVPDLVIAPSMYAVGIASFFNARKTAYIPPTIDVDSYTPTMYEGKKFVSVGRFQTVNDHFTPLNAFRRIATEFPGTSYNIIGSGTYDTLYRAAVREYGLTQSVGVFTDDPAPYQEKADIGLVCTITAMGVNTVILEALAAGCYTIVSDVGGFDDLRSVTKVRNVDNLTGWYDAMRAAVSDRNMARRAIVKQFREVEKYDTGKVNILYPEIIRHILEE